MSWHGASCDHVAHGLHRCGEESAIDIYRCRSCLDGSLCWSWLGVCPPLRVKRCRHRVLRLLCRSRIHDISDRSRGQWVSLVACQRQDWLTFSLVHRRSFLQLLPVASAVRHGDWGLGNDSERLLYDPSFSEPCIVRPNSTVRETFASLVAVCAWQNLLRGCKAEL